jgi:hypothetical protein
MKGTKTMKQYYKYLLIGIILLIGLAFLPHVINAFSEDFSWERYAKVYQDFKIFIPLAVK